jgi:hypothetical protein
VLGGLAVIDASRSEQKHVIRQQMEQAYRSVPGMQAPWQYRR